MIPNPSRAVDATHELVESILAKREPEWTELMNAVSKCVCGHTLFLLSEYYDDNFLPLSCNDWWHAFLFAFRDLDSENAFHMNILQMFLEKGEYVDEPLQDINRMDAAMPLFFSDMFDNSEYPYMPTILDSFFFYYDKSQSGATHPHKYPCVRCGDVEDADRGVSGEAGKNSS